MLHTVGRLGSEPRPVDYETEPTAYIERLREFYYNNAGSARMPTHAVAAQMEREAELSTAFAREACADPTDPHTTPEDGAWAGEGFPRLMALVVKASAKAAEQEDDIPAFSSIDEAGQGAIRRQMFEEYVEACKFLALTDTPPKNLYLSSVFLYRNLGEIQDIINRNEDLGPRNVISALVRQPASVEETLDACRDKIEAAKKMFPTLSHEVIRYRVLSSPNAYERSLRAYAEERGFVVDPAGEDQEPPDAETFLRQFRELVARARPGGLGGLIASEEATETARQLSEEALSAADPEASAGDPMYAGPYEDPEVREAYRQKIELLMKAADTAWRHGELPVAPARLSAEFRAALYSRVLGDFLKIHVELGESAPALNRVLYYDAEQIQQLVTANPDIPLAYFRHKLPHKPEEAPASIEQFRARLAEIRQANPRLLEHQVVRRALVNSHTEAAPETEPGDRLAPDAFVREIRTYLNTVGDIKSAPSRQAREEIVERLGEIEDCLEAAGWQFADLHIPDTFRPAIIKKLEEFILAANRAYRNGEIAVGLVEYDQEERMEMYGMVAENYARIVTLLGTNVLKAWRRNPALYVDAAELTELRERHAWLHDSNFREIVVENPGLIVVALERALQVRVEVKRLYPGLGDSVIETLVKNSPSTAIEKAMAHIHKVTEGEFRRYGSIKEPDVTNPVQVYRYYRTLIRYGQMPDSKYFDRATELAIAEVLDRASSWVRDQKEMEDADDAMIRKFLGQVERCLRGSQMLRNEGAGPGMLDQPDAAQIRIVRAMFRNQVDLNEMVAGVSNGNGSKFKFYGFGFAHEAKYLRRLWKEYEAYMPRNIITYVALKSPHRPYKALNVLVEHRARLLMDNPDLDQQEVVRAVAAAAQS